MVAGREGIVRDLGKVKYTLLYLKWMTNKDLLYGTWNSAQCYVAAWMGGAFTGGWIHVNVWLSPFSCSSETITTLLIGYTPIQNKTLKFGKEKKEFACCNQDPIQPNKYVKIFF